MVQAHFRGVLDDQQPLRTVDFLDQGVEQSGLPTAGAARNHDGLAARDGGAQEAHEVARVEQGFEVRIGGGFPRQVRPVGGVKQAVAIEFVEGHVGEDVLAHGHHHAPAGGRRGDDLHARAVRQGGGQQGLLAVDALVARGGDLMGQALQRLFRQLFGRLAGHVSACRLDPDLAGPIDQQVCDVRAGKPGC